MLNYFSVGDKFYLVDMPGYGYAKAPIHVVKEWHQLVLDFFKARKTLKMIYLLFDARLGELKKSDHDFIQVLKTLQLPFTVIYYKKGN